MKCHALFSLKNHVLKDQNVDYCSCDWGFKVFNHCVSVVSYKMDNMGHHSHPLPRSQGISFQGDRGIHGGPTMTW